MFRIEPSRSTQVLADHLGIDLAAGRLQHDRQLLVSSDFHTVYQALGLLDGVEPLWCWAHMRRYFLHAGQVHPELAGWVKGWVERIGVLSAAHHAVVATTPHTPTTSVPCTPCGQRWARSIAPGAPKPPTRPCPPRPQDPGHPGP